MRGILLFDWGDTLMQDLGHPGPMARWPEVRAVDGAAAVLERLSGPWRLCLATGAADSGEALIREALARAGLERYLERVFCKANVGAAKGDPDYLPAVARALGAAPACCVVVGDSVRMDVAPALGAGMAAVWLNRNAAADRIGPRLRTIRRLRGLPDALDDLADEPSGIRAC